MRTTTRPAKPSPSVPARIAAVAALPLAVLMLALPACSSDPAQGYSFTPAHRSDVQTVHIPMFGNETFTRGLETELTDALIKEVQRNTPYRVVGATGAQTLLSGTITASKLRSLSQTRETGYVQEQAVILTVEFEWKDQRTGKVLAARKNFTASDSFAPAKGLNERIEVGQHGAVQNLARDIVAELRGGW